MNLFKLVGQLAIEGADEAKNEIRDVTDEAEGSSGKLGNALSKIGNVALGIGKSSRGRSNSKCHSNNWCYKVSSGCVCSISAISWRC